jgi:hypothetical protein
VGSSVRLRHGRTVQRKYLHELRSFKMMRHVSQRFTIFPWCVYNGGVTCACFKSSRQPLCPLFTGFKVGSIGLLYSACSSWLKPHHLLFAHYRNVKLAVSPTCRHCWLRDNSRGQGRLELARLACHLVVLLADSSKPPQGLWGTRKLSIVKVVLQGTAHQKCASGRLRTAKGSEIC